jgi:aquaporin Z
MKVHDRTVPWLLLGAELIGTALLIGVGLSIVIMNFGQGSPMSQIIRNAGERRLLTGFLFGTTLIFTFFWPEVDQWEGTNFSVMVE